MTDNENKDLGWQTVYGQTPSKSNSYRIIKLGNHASLAKTPALKTYEEQFYLQCGKYRNIMIEGFFEFHIKVYYSSMRSDLDGVFKVTLDSLQHCKAIKNDNRCMKIVAEKFVDKMNPRVEFRIIPIE